MDAAVAALLALPLPAPRLEIRDGKVDHLRVRSKVAAVAGRIDQCEDCAAAVVVVARGRDALAVRAEEQTIERDCPFHIWNGQYDAKEFR